MSLICFLGNRYTKIIWLEPGRRLHTILGQYLTHSIHLSPQKKSITEFRRKRPSWQWQVSGCQGAFGDEWLKLLTHFKDDPSTSEWGTKISFFSVSDGFLPKSSITCLDFFHVDQERGEEAWSGNCPCVVCSFSVLAKAESSGASPSNLPPEGRPFPSWLEVTLPLPTLPELSQMAGLVMVAWL